MNFVSRNTSTYAHIEKERESSVKSSKFEKPTNFSLYIIQNLRLKNIMLKNKEYYVACVRAVGKQRGGSERGRKRERNLMKILFQNAHKLPNSNYVKTKTHKMDLFLLCLGLHVFNYSINAPV